MKYISLLSLLFLFTACHQDKKADMGPAAAKSGLVVSAVEGFTVKPSVLTENVTASGSILAAEETELHPFHFEQGDVFHVY